MNNPASEFEKKFAQRNKPKSKLEEDSFIDWEMIYSFLISAVLHFILIFFALNIIWLYYGDSYNQLAHKIRKKPFKDLVFHLIPGNTKKGEMNYQDLIKAYTSIPKEKPVKKP